MTTHLASDVVLFAIFCDIGDINSGMERSDQGTSLHGRKQWSWYLVEENLELVSLDRNSHFVFGFGILPFRTTSLF